MRMKKTITILSILLVTNFAVVSIASGSTSWAGPTPVTNPWQQPTAQVNYIDNYGDYSAVATMSSPYLFIYKKVDGTFTNLYPDANPAGDSRGVRFSSDGTYLAVGHGNSPRLTVYKRNGDAFTKLPTIANTPTSGTGYGLDFTNNNSHLAVAHSSSPYITIYRNDDDTFTRLSDPANLPTGAGNDADFSPNGTFLAVAHSTSPYITIYKRDGDTFTKLANPGTLPTGAGQSVRFSSDGIYLAIAHTTSPYVTIYSWDDGNSTFAKVGNPGTLPTGNGVGVRFSSDDIYFAVSHTTSPYVTIYNRSGDIFTKVADPDVTPAGQGRAITFLENDSYFLYLTSASTSGSGYGIGYFNIYRREGDTFTRQNTNPDKYPRNTPPGKIDFSHDSTYLVYPYQATSPYLAIYKRNEDNFTMLANPQSLPANNGYVACFSHDDKYLVVGHAVSPYVTIYKHNGDIFDISWEGDSDWNIYNIDAEAEYWKRLADNPHTGTYSFKCKYDAVGPNDDWLVTKPVEVPEHGGNFSLWIKGYGSSPDDTYEIYYSTTGNTTTDFLSYGTLLESGTAPGSYTVKAYDMDNESGNTTWFAVRYTGSQAWYLWVDDFTFPDDSTIGFETISIIDTLPTGSVWGASFSSDDTYLATSHINSPYVTIYKKDNGTFTKLADPDALPTSTGDGRCCFSPDDTYLAIGLYSSPYIIIYKRNGDNFTKLEDPAILPTGYADDVAFSPDGNYLAVAHLNSPYVTIYKRNGDNFTKVETPYIIPGGTGRSVAFSSDSKYLVVGHSNSPYVMIYRRNADIFTKLLNPICLPAGYVSGLCFSPDDSYLAVGVGTGGFASSVVVYKQTDFSSENSPNQPTDEYPVNNSEYMTPDTFINITVSDPDDDNMTVSFYWSNDSHIATLTDVVSGSVASIWLPDYALIENESEYSWYAVIDDGIDVIASPIWTFSTNIPLTPEPTAEGNPITEMLLNMLPMIVAFVFVFMLFGMLSMGILTVETFLSLLGTAIIVYIILGIVTALV